MKDLIFVATMAVDSLLVATVIQSWMCPSRRIWPPPARTSWQFYWTWVLVVLLCLGLLGLTILDWDTFLFSHRSRFILGAALFLLGNVLALWGVVVLSPSSTVGLKGRLVTSGPYRLSRNPQYLGDTAILFGVAILANSSLVWLAVAPALLACFVAPFAEELWLMEQYGDEYERYRQKVNRFL